MGKKEKFNPEKEVHRGDIAQGVLNCAMQQIKAKGVEHGDTVNSFVMIAQMWSTYIKNVAVVNGYTEVGPQDVAKMMAILKLCRSVWGESGDNYVDGAGYTALAAMLTPDNTEEV